MPSRDVLGIAGLVFVLRKDVVKLLNIGCDPRNAFLRYIHPTDPLVLTDPKLASYKISQPSLEIAPLVFAPLPYVYQTVHVSFLCSAYETERRYDSQVARTAPTIGAAAQG